MPNLNIRNIPEELRRKIKSAAADRGETMEQYIRRVLQTAVTANKEEE